MREKTLKICHQFVNVFSHPTFFAIRYALVMCNIDDMNIYPDISACDMT